MPLDLTPEQKTIGRTNFNETATELTRRGFMKSMVAAGGAVAVAGTAGYFGYQKLSGRPIKAALIGAGDEGGVLVGEHNPEFIEFIAVCDLRPSNRKRVFDGEGKESLRKGLKHHYGATCEQQIKSYTDYKELLANERDVEAVVIATPLISHAPIAIGCLQAGKHVFCEKLMARTVSQCKEMIRAAANAHRILAIGHQRHYSMLYAHTSEILDNGVLGDVKHIRALWHRNFTFPRMDGTKLTFNPETGDPIVVEGKPAIDAVTKQLLLRDGWTPPINKDDLAALEKNVRQHGYKDIFELCHWKLYNRTGGGLMAELGAHQLDACSIFLGKVHPLSVVGVGTHSFYGHNLGDGKPNPREIDDHVFVTLEYPGKNHPKGPNKGSDADDIVVVTYSSISTNGFEPYGECVFGTRGSMIVEAEQNVYMFAEKDPNKKWLAAPKATTISVTTGNKPVLEAGPTWGGPVAVAAKATSGMGGPVSRGYREELEDFAYCVKLWNESPGEHRLPRCHGEVAMADAIVALTANVAMRNRQRIEFSDDWFKVNSPAVPDGDLKLETI